MSRWRLRTLTTAGAIGLAVLILGPVLKPGSLFLLDLTAVSDPPFPRGFFGLGPEIPRSTPFDVLVYLPSWLLDGTTAVRAVMVGSIALCAVGMFRLVHRHGLLAAASSALLFAGNPFILTRLSVGHLSMVMAGAILTFVLPWLARSPADLRRTFLATLALCATGSYGGILAALVVASATVRGDLRRLPATAAVVAAACSIWLVPGAIVMSGVPTLASSARFPSGTRSLGQIMELFAGHGFWQRPYQVGSGQVGVGLIGLVLLVLALLGSRRLPVEWGRGLSVAAAVSVGLSVASGLPGLDRLVEAATSSPVGAPFREGQRYLLIYLVWMAAAAPLGAQRIVRAGRSRTSARAILVLPLALGVILVAPGTWGLAPHVRAVDVPIDWERARAVVRSEGGTTLALPWDRYLSLRFANAPRSINPVPKFLGTDTLVSTDLGIGGSSTEGIDPREAAAKGIADRIAAGGDGRVVEDLQRLGVRWILVLHEADHERFVPGLESLSLDHVLVGSAASLYRVPGVAPQGVTSRDEPVEVHGASPVVASADTADPFTWYRGHQSGWLRGTQGVDATAEGLMAVPGHGGLIWFWPAALIAVTYGAVITAAVRAGVRVRRPPLRAADEPGPPG